MTDRIGVCGGCQAKFKVPGSFQGTRAKCKKCGGVVEIAAAPSTEPTEQPEAAASTGGSSRAGGRRAGRAGGRTAGAGSKTGRSRTRRAAGGGDEAAGGAGRRRAGAGGRAGRGRRELEPKKNNTMLMVGIGAAVVIVIVISVIMFGPDDEPVVTSVAAANEVADIRTSPLDETIDTSPIEEAVTEPDPEPVVEQEPEPEPEPQTPVLAFEPFGKMPDVDDAEWERIQNAVKTYYLESASRKDAREAKATLEEAAEVQIPALINALNGLDISNDADFVKSGNLILAIQEKSLDLIMIPYKVNVMTMAENQEHNLQAVASLLKYWRTKDGDAGAKSLASFRVKLAKKMEEAASTDDDDFDN